MKFNYKFEETSTDTRHFYIESEVELIEDEVELLVSETDLIDGNTESYDFSDWPEENGLPSKGSYKITFRGTEYGDDSQSFFTEIKVIEND
tara:strand:+ start:231 stop:503 length:273 start_codon:yes stop_codon:yes gene_type:complete